MKGDTDEGRDGERWREMEGREGGEKIAVKGGREREKERKRGRKRERGGGGGGERQREGEKQRENE